MIDERTADALTRAVREVAAAEIMPRFRALDPAEIDVKTGSADLVTVADRAAEAALAARIADILPGAAIVGEEAAEDAPAPFAPLSGTGTVAVIDPIDGTWNFARGLATFGVILAVRMGGQTVLGLIHEPVLDAWLIARPGRGAWACRAGARPRRLWTAPARDEADETGYLPIALFPERQRAGLAPLFARFGRVQSLRSAAQEYRMIAAGHADWMVAAQSKPWDHLAGALIVTEAGGAWGPLDDRRHDPARCDAVLLAASSAARRDALRETVEVALGSGGGCGADGNTLYHDVKHNSA